MLSLIQKCAMISTSLGLNPDLLKEQGAFPAAAASNAKPVPYVPHPSGLDLCPLDQWRLAVDVLLPRLRRLIIHFLCIALG